MYGISAYSKLWRVSDQFSYTALYFRHGVVESTRVDQITELVIFGIQNLLILISCNFIKASHRIHKTVTCCVTHLPSSRPQMIMYISINGPQIIPNYLWYKWKPLCLMINRIISDQVNIHPFIGITSLILDCINIILTLPVLSIIIINTPHYENNILNHS